LETVEYERFESSKTRQNQTKRQPAEAIFRRAAKLADLKKRLSFRPTLKKKGARTKMNSQIQKNFAPTQTTENDRTEAFVKCAYNFEEDLIAVLQNRRENRRARQVFEWETVRRKTPQNVI
jgi:hypothetical protein